jgi:hypothetical protein
VLRIRFGFNSDPDPAFFVNADSYTNSDPDPRFRGPKMEKNLLLKLNYIFLIQNCNLPIARPPERTSKLQEKSSSIKIKHLALQNLNFLHFVGHVGPPG